MKVHNLVVTGSLTSGGENIGSISSSVATTNNAQDGRLTSLESTTGSIISKTGSYSTTGSNVFVGNQTISGSIIPAVNGVYDLGSSTHEFRHLYLSSASLYIDGTKVLGSTTQELQITTDTGQSFKILESGSDTITLQSNDGNITLATSGGGDIILDPTSGIIALKGSTQVYAGNRILSSDGNAIHFGNGVTISGSLLATGTNIISGSQQISDFGYTTTSSVNTISSSINTRIDSNANIQATTGSNNFVGTQTITGSLYISQNLIVQGSSSLQDVTGSNVYIGTNKINLNTDTPSIRFGGISVFDSGSNFGESGSLLWDSQNNRWLYQHPASSGAPYKSAIIISGPQNSGSLGGETTLTSGKISKAVGDDHIGDSIITETGGGIGIGGSLSISGSIVATGTSLVSGSSQVDVMSTTNIARLATTGSNVFTGALTGTTAAFSSTVSGTSVRSNGVGTFGFNTANNGEFQIYATVADGMIMAGRGSTHDMVITNKSGSDVFRIPTGTINANFVGNVGIGISNPQSSLHIIKSLGNDAISIGESGTNTRLALGQESSYAGNYIDSKNIDLKFKSYLAGGTGGNIIFQTGDGTVENRFRINTDGRVQVVGVGNQLTFDTLDGSNTVTMGAINNYEFRINNARGTNSSLVLGNTNIDLYTASTLRLRINDTGDATYTGPISFSSSITTSGYHYSQGSTALRKTLNITEGVTTTLLSFDQAGSYGHTGGGEILVVFVDPGSPWGVYVWKGLLTIRTVTFTGAYYGSGLSTISSNSTIDGSFSIDATFTKSYGSGNGEVRVRAIPGSGIGGTAYVYWNGLVTQGGNAY